MSELRIRSRVSPARRRASAVAALALTTTACAVALAGAIAPLRAAAADPSSTGPVNGTEMATPTGGCSGAAQTFGVTETRSGNQLTIDSQGGRSTGSVSADGTSADTNGPGGSYHVVADSPTHQTITESFGGCSYQGTIDLSAPGLTLGTLVAPSSTPTATPGATPTPGTTDFVETPPPPALVPSSSLWPSVTVFALLIALLGLLILLASAVTVSDEETAEVHIKKEQAAESDPVELTSRRSTIKYTITVTNKGPAAAQNVVVGDYMLQTSYPVDDVENDPVGYRETAEVKVAKDATSDNDQAVCKIAKDDQGRFTSGAFKLPLLAKGAVWTITYQVEPTADGNAVNAAAVKCDNQGHSWRQRFTLLAAQYGVAQSLTDLWHHFDRAHHDEFKWATDASITIAKVVDPKKL